MLDAVTLSLLTCSNASIALCFQYSTVAGSYLQAEARIPHLVGLAILSISGLVDLDLARCNEASILLSVGKAALALRSRAAARTSGYAVGHKVSLHFHLRPIS